MLAKRISVFVAVAMLAMLLLPLSQPTYAQDTVRIAFRENDARTLDPQAASGTDDFLALRNICEGLVDYDPVTLAPIPALAEAWKISEDGTVYTFMLRPDVTFHNGRKMTAEDVVYSFTRLGNPNTGTSYTAGLVLGGVKGYSAMRAQENRATTLEGVKALDEMTVQITLNAPRAAFLQQLTLPGAFIVDREAAEREGFNENPVCTGPYKVREWQRQQRLVLEAYDGYWGGAPKVKTVEIRVLPQQSLQVLEFEGGNLDAAWVPEAELPRLRADSQLSPQLLTIPVLSLFHLRVNLKDPIMSDARVRRAFVMAIDRQVIVDTVLQGQGSPAKGVFPPGLPARDPNFDPLPYNVEMAKQLLAEAGYPNGVDLEVRTGEIETERRIMAAVAQQVAAAGIRLRVNATEKSVYDQDRAACNMQMGTIGWGMDYPDPDNIITVAIAAGSRVRAACGYDAFEGHDEIKALIDKAGAMPIGEERNAVYREAEKLVMEKALILPIVHYSRSLLANDVVRAAVDNQGELRFFRIK
jgi:peptide/nickel transport system substrate-binding protein/oligopeptide transport system substrate-binding protein